MTSLPKKARGRLTFACTSILSILAWTLLVIPTGQAQQLQKGIHVEMPITTGAASLPDADNPDAWIVTVTENGDLYFGVDPVRSDSLLEAMRSKPRIRSQELYIKADGRASFSSVQRVLETAQAALFKRAILLSAQTTATQSGQTIPPHGLPVWFSSPETREAGAVVVQIGPGQSLPTLRVDNEEVPLKELQQRLAQLLQNRPGVVVLKPGQVSFANVAHVVDICHMSGAKPVLSTPEL